jgi:hypothetical protein
MHTSAEFCVFVSRLTDYSRYNMYSQSGHIYQYSRSGHVYQYSQSGHIFQTTIKYTKGPLSIPNSYKIFQMVIKHTNIFYTKALDNVYTLNLGFLSCTSNICQPCLHSVSSNTNFCQIHRYND